jgi:hypothetical protein
MDLLQQGNLTGVVELVLHNAAEHVEEVVVVLSLAGNLVL